MKLNFVEIIDSTTRDMGKLLTQSLVKFAISDGWPVEVASQLKVKQSGKRFEFDIDSSVSKQAMDIEFGTEGTSPRGTLRRFGNRNDIAGKLFSKIAVQKVGGKR